MLEWDSGLDINAKGVLLCMKHEIKAMRKTGGGATALHDAANALLTRAHRFSTLERWALDLAKRRGMRRAKVALARKLATVACGSGVDGGRVERVMAEQAGELNQLARVVTQIAQREGVAQRVRRHGNPFQAGTAAQAGDDRLDRAHRRGRVAAAEQRRILGERGGAVEMVLQRARLTVAGRRPAATMCWR